MKLAMMGACTAMALALSLPAQAQTVEPDPIAFPQEDGVVVTPSDDDVVVVEPPSNAGAYEALPPGGRKIAEGLFAAQSGATAAADGSPATGWTLDDIAAARAGGGWGQVFKQMQAQGLVSAKTLGEAVSGRAAPSPVTVRQTPVVVTYGSGDAATIAATGGKTHRHAAPTVVTANGGGGGATKIHAAPSHAHGGHAAAAVSISTANNGAPGNAAAKVHGNKHGK